MLLFIIHCAENRVQLQFSGALIYLSKARCATCMQVLDAYENSQEEEPAAEAYERSELVLYKASVLAEGGKAAEALALLDASQVGMFWDLVAYASLSVASCESSAKQDRMEFLIVPGGG